MPFGMLTHHINLSGSDHLNSFVKSYVSRKYNGWSTIWDGGITKGLYCKDIPWAYEKDEVISTGLWTLGRSAGVPEGFAKVQIAPDYFTRDLPKIPLHGELWFNDRLDTIQEVCGTKRVFKPYWEFIKFIPFNIKPYNLFLGIDKLRYQYPRRFDHSFQLEKLTFEEVLPIIQDIKSPRVIKPDFVLVSDLNTALDWTETAKRSGWEGVMFAKPSGSYELKRSYNVMKWKSVFEAEAVVIGFVEGKVGKTGRNHGMIGSLICELTWDEKVLSVFGGKTHHVNKKIHFNVNGLETEERDYVLTPYWKGQTVKFKYAGVTFDGIPQSANIYRGI